jgi:hypothetical protein
VDASVWPLWLSLFVVFAWVVFIARPRHPRGPWGFGARYGGPDFGIPIGWPNALPFERSDQLIAEHVSARLRVHHELDASDVHVQVHDGRVELTGMVEHREDRGFVEALVHTVPGAVAVDNQLMVDEIRQP